MTEKRLVYCTDVFFYSFLQTLPNARPFLFITTKLLTLLAFQQSNFFYDLLSFDAHILIQKHFYMFSVGNKTPSHVSIHIANDNNNKKEKKEVEVIHKEP